MSLAYIPNSRFARERINVLKVYYSEKDFLKETIFTISDRQGLREIFPFEHTLHNILYSSDEFHADKVIREGIIYEFISQLLEFKVADIDNNMLVKNSVSFLLEWLDDLKLTHCIVSGNDAGTTMNGTISGFLSRCKSCCSEFGEIIPYDNLCKITVNKGKCKSIHKKDFVDRHKNKIDKVVKDFKEFCFSKLFVSDKSRDENSTRELVNSINKFKFKIRNITNIFVRKIKSKKFLKHVLDVGFKSSPPIINISGKGEDGKLYLITNIGYPPRKYDKRDKEFIEGISKMEDGSHDRRLDTCRKGYWLISERYFDTPGSWNNETTTGMKVITLPRKEIIAAINKREGNNLTFSIRKNQVTTSKKQK